MTVGETRTFRLSGRLSVDLTVSPVGITAEWTPASPKSLDGGMTPREVHHYRRARKLMLSRLAQELGGSIVVVET